MASFVVLLGVLTAPAVLALDRAERFSLNPMDMLKSTTGIDLSNGLVDKVAGAAIGGMGLVWGEQENKKCYYYWGLGFSGPDSINPERWNGAKWDEEDTGGLMHAASNAAGMALTATLMPLMDEGARVQGCKMLGMGYPTQQPGFPSKPGTCPEGPGCGPTSGGPGPTIIHYPGPTTVVTPGSPGYITTTTNPGSPGYNVITQGTPGYTTTVLHPNDPGYTVTNPGRPGYETTVVHPGDPGYTVTNPGRPGYTITTRIPGQPGQPDQCFCPCLQ